MKKAVIIGVVLLILVFWGSAILPWLVEALEIFLETLELITERVLEALLALSPYQAQATTAWLGFGLAVFLLVIGYRKLSAWWRRMQARLPAWLEEEKARLAAMRYSLGWTLGLILIVGLLVLIYL